MPSRPSRRFPGLALVGLLLPLVTRAAPPPPDLAGQAQGILARRCVSCHGAGKTSGLDLRTREALLRGGGRGAAVVPGRPGDSLLVHLASGVRTPRMPPAAPLPRPEVEILRRWVAAGAPWEPWWAFRPLRQPAAPAVHRAGWVRNPIDAFVLARLEAARLEPAPEAGPRDLIRRVTFGLTGLPPTPEEVETFAATAPGRERDRAYELAVDRLLASPHYGERWARYWLDVVRFGESQGFERDKIKENAWRYRDYVVRAFNADLSYDRFVREQIAGDVLEGATAESIAATGFLVAGPYDEVGQSQPSIPMRMRVRQDELEDVVAATAQTFLGLTVNCARCHDHKFDPLAQRDYYRFQAALAGVTHGQRSLLTPEEQSRQQEQLRTLDRQAAEAEVEHWELLARGRSRLTARPAEWVEAPRPRWRWTFDRGAADESGALALTLGGGAVVAGGRLRLWQPGSHARGVVPPAAGTARTLELWVDLQEPSQPPASLFTLADSQRRRFEGLGMRERQWRGIASLAARTAVGAPHETAPRGTLVHLAAVYGADGSIALYRGGQPAGRRPAAGSIAALEAPWHLTLGGAAPGTAGRPPGLRCEVEEARLYDRALSPEEVAASFRSGPPPVTRQESLAALSPEERSRLEAASAAPALCRGERERLLAAEPRAYAAVPAPAPVVRVLARGSLDQPGDTVSPGGLECLPGLGWDLGLAPDAPEAERRRRLAEWIVSPRNPLTARVIANRVWQGHFGRGLAASPSDFGLNGGEPPVHAALLDYLAHGFQHGPRAGSLKALHRLLVTSATYRQSVRAPASSRERDPENRLLGRMEPRRLTAEEVRDAMLAVSGELNPAVGGPGFRPFIITESNTHFYAYEDRVGPEYNRRSLYRTVVNSGGIPLLEAFDCPDPSVKTPRRATTTTPLQALALMNSSFVLRQARAMSARIERVQPKPGARVAQAYLQVFGRAPTAVEARRGATFVSEHGLAAFCRVLLNASEFVYVR